MMMNIVTLINISLLTTVLIAPMACEDVAPEASEEQIALNLTPEEEKKVRQDNDFTIDLFNQAVSGMKEGDNLLLSPISANMVLSMLSNGAAGTTKDSFQRTLGFGDFNQLEVNQYYKKLLNSLPHLDSDRKSTRLNSSHVKISYAVFCLKKKKKKLRTTRPTHIIHITYR